MRIVKATWFAVIGVLLSLFAVGAAWALPPRITWEPERLAPASIAPGESVTYAVTLTHTGYLPIPATKQLRIVPEGALAHYVTVTPPTFPPVLKRGDRVTVQLTVTAPADAPLSVVRDEILLERIPPNGKTMEVFRAEALPVELTFSPFPLPPDPGEAGKATLEGIDANANGVRDDVERWITFTHPNSERERASLVQTAMSLEGIVIGLETPEDSRARSQRASDCEGATFMANEADLQGGMRALEAFKALRATVLNTPERIEQYGQYSDALSGTFSKSTPFAEMASRCLIRPSSFSN